jgi:hypothetical protein
MASLLLKWCATGFTFQNIRLVCELFANDTPVLKHGFSSNDYEHFDFFNNSVVCLSRDIGKHKPSTLALNFIFLLLLAH